MSDTAPSASSAPQAAAPLPVDPIVSDAMAAATLTQTAQQVPNDPTTPSRHRERSVPLEVTPDVLPLEAAKDTAKDQEKTPARESATAVESTPTQSELATEQASRATASGEAEPNRELEPETEKVVEMMEKREIPAPKETITTPSSDTSPKPHTVAKPVVILPLTENEFSKGKRSPIKNSIRWLYQFCVRQIDRFRLQAKTLVLYREKP